MPGASLHGPQRSQSWWHGHSWLLFVLATLAAASLSRLFPLLVGHNTSCPLALLSRSTRKRARQRNRSYITCRAVRFSRIVTEVFLNHVNDLECGYSAGHAGHPVPSRDTEQLPVHQETIGEALRPAQTRRIALDADSVPGPFTVHA